MTPPSEWLEVAGYADASGLVVLEDPGVRRLIIRVMLLAHHMVGSGDFLPLVFMAFGHMAFGGLPVASGDGEHRSEDCEQRQERQDFGPARHYHYWVADPFDVHQGPSGHFTPTYR